MCISAWFALPDRPLIAFCTLALLLFSFFLFCLFAVFFDFSRASGSIDLAKPAASHPTRFINFVRDKDKLLLADPPLSVYQPPEDPQFLENQVQFLEFGAFAGAWSIQSPYHAPQSVQCPVVNPLTEAKPMAFRNVGSTLEGPTYQIDEYSIEWRAGEGGSWHGYQGEPG